jgi:small-conductance mechanosensitive channel
MDAEDFESAFKAIVAGIRSTIRTEFTSIWLPIQLAAIGLAILIAIGIAAVVRKKFDLTSATMGWPAFLRLVVRALMANVGVIVFILVLTMTVHGIRASVEFPRTYLLRVATDLATAWLVINILASLIRNQFVNRVVAVSAWSIAALSILRLLDPLSNSLDSFSIAFGGLRLTPLLILKTTALMLLTLWAAVAASNFLDRRIRNISDLTPSIQVLIGKLVRVALLTFAVVLVLSSVGIDLSVLAVFTGAVGVGIGFGLQKIVSNLVSGIILLADKSIKPGDIISVGDHFGFVGNMGARYTSVDTRDGREYLIPNEDFVTQRVVNWSYSNDLVRLDVKFSTVYNDNPRKAQGAAVEAALSVPRVLKTPAPICHLTAFGASAIEYSLWFWIKDPGDGIMNLRSAVLLALWDTLEREGVSMPKPGPARVIYEKAPEML